MRFARVTLKRDLDERRALASDVIADPPAYTATMRVFTLLMAARGIGPSTAHRYMLTCRISAAKTVGGLTERQREVIVEHLRRFGR